MTRDHNFRRENTVDQNHLLGATPTRDLNSFKHFSGPKNKTLSTSSQLKVPWQKLSIGDAIVRRKNDATVNQVFQRATALLEDRMLFVHKLFL